MNNIAQIVDDLSATSKQVEMSLEVRAELIRQLDAIIFLMVEPKLYYIPAVTVSTLHRLTGFYMNASIVTTLFVYVAGKVVRETVDREMEQQGLTKIDWNDPRNCVPFIELYQAIAEHTEFEQLDKEVIVRYGAVNPDPTMIDVAIGAISRGHGILSDLFLALLEEPLDPHGMGAAMGLCGSTLLGIPGDAIKKRLSENYKLVIQKFIGGMPGDAEIIEKTISLIGLIASKQPETDHPLFTGISSKSLNEIGTFYKSRPIITFIISSTQAQGFERRLGQTAITNILSVAKQNPDALIQLMKTFMETSITQTERVIDRIMERAVQQFGDGDYDEEKVDPVLRRAIDATTHTGIGAIARQMTSSHKLQ